MDFDYDDYGENTVDDMMIDYDYHINTGELSDWFDDDVDEENCDQS